MPFKFVPPDSSQNSPPSSPEPLAKSAAFKRVVPPAKQRRSGATPAITILFLAANPGDTQYLQLDEEVRAIDRALRLTAYRDQFNLVQHWAVRADELPELLLRHQPDIVHFSGHGSSKGEIILKSDNGDSDPVSSRLLTSLFATLKDNIRCIVLNACYSEIQAQAIAQNIEVVVGMNTAIGDDAAIKFAAAFYEALGYGRSVQTAFELGCYRIGVRNPNEQNTPQLLCINGDASQLVLATSNHVLENREPGGRDQIINITMVEASKSKPFASWEPETVWITAGEFVLGRNDGNPEEAPMHVLNLPEFSIGKYPVMNWQYAEYIWAKKLMAPSALLWDGNSPPEGESEHPVTGVTWYEAQDYCNWLFDETGRKYALPSEAQWEKAARGSDGRIYPWGNRWEPTRCNTDEGHLMSAKTFDAQSVFGCYDMVGNAREWTTSLWGKSVQQPEPKYQYPWPEDHRKWDERNKISEPVTFRRVFRGGRHSNPAVYRCTFRGGTLPDSRGPKNNRHGFRVILIQE